MKQNLQDYQPFLVILVLDLQELNSSLSKYQPYVVHPNMYQPRG
jgi:hypothetical protein